MDNNFQTSFIPKKPLAEERTQVIQHTSIFSFIATLIFFGALAAGVGMYFYKASLTKNITSMQSQLESSRDSFEPTLIATLQTLDRRITNANTLLNNHIVVTPIFDALEINTLKTIQFTKFSYITPSDTASPILVHMSGRARSYSDIALQSDQLATNPNIHNSIFSDLSLDQKTGMVSFNLNFNIDSSLVRFVNHLTPVSSQSGGQQQFGGDATPTSPVGGTPVSSGGTTPSGGTTGSTTPKSQTPTGGGSGGQMSETQAQILQNLATQPVAPH